MHGECSQMCHAASVSAACRGDLKPQVLNTGLSYETIAYGLKQWFVNLQYLFCFVFRNNNGGNSQKQERNLNLTATALLADDRLRTKVSEHMDKIQTTYSENWKI